jgi:Tripartite tricarboxylate transporter TctA family
MVRPSVVVERSRPNSLPTAFPAIIGFCCIGILSISNNPCHVYTMIAFGLGGYLLMRLDFEPAPLLLGLVIGPMLEENLRRSFTLSGGDPRFSSSGRSRPSCSPSRSACWSSRHCRQFGKDVPRHLRSAPETSVPASLRFIAQMIPGVKHIRCPSRRKGASGCAGRGGVKIGRSATSDDPSCRGRRHPAHPPHLQAARHYICQRPLDAFVNATTDAAPLAEITPAPYRLIGRASMLSDFAEFGESACGVAAPAIASNAAYSSE